MGVYLLKQVYLLNIKSTSISKDFKTENMTHSVENANDDARMML